MITLQDYFKFRKTDNPEFLSNAENLLDIINTFLAYMEILGWKPVINPKTQTLISGQTDGGFRDENSKTGTTTSKHRIAHAVDIYDPNNELDLMITDDMLEDFELYREHPDSTLTWCHLQDIPPGSKKRTYYP